MCNYIYNMFESYTRCEIQAFCIGVKKNIKKNPTEQEKNQERFKNFASKIIFFKDFTSTKKYMNNSRKLRNSSTSEHPV